MTQTDHLVSAENLLIGFSGAKPILPPISFALDAGQVTSIVGHNGSGKSTLLRTLLGILPKLGGDIRFRHGTRIGYVPQREAMDPIYPIRVEELVETGRYGLRGMGRWLTDADHEKVASALFATGITSLRHRLFRTLSGGEQQRALLARALCTEPNLLILDEPTAALDEKGAVDVMNLTLALAKKEKAAVLMVNHFIDLVSNISDQVLVLDRDHQAFQAGKPEEVLKNRGRIYG